jgi:hypothetical protein
MVKEIQSFLVAAAETAGGGGTDVSSVKVGGVRTPAVPRERHESKPLGAETEGVKPGHR